MSSAEMDLMSSPDPLIESVVPSSTAPYTRRITRSQRTQRFASLSQSPRKRTFELDVGDERSPQKILVTVEADGSDKENGVSRRLFAASPTPRSGIRRREMTTTTSVPLKGLTDDEGAATPRKRGRPRRSGTPTPGTRKRAGTPIKGTPRQTRRARLASEDTASEISLASDQATPKAPRVKKTPKKKSATPAKAKEPKSAPDSQPRKRGRPRKALAPEEAEVIAEQEYDATETTIIVSDPSVSSIDDAPASPLDDRVLASDPGVAIQAPDATEDNFDAGDAAEGGGGDDDDMWLINVPEPSIRRQYSNRGQADTSASFERSVPRSARSTRSTRSTRSQTRSSSPGRARSESDGAPEAMMDMDHRSEAESVISEGIAPSVGGQDTIVNGEDFSMISFDTMQSFHANSSMHEAALPEMGEVTSLIVSRTLESLRHDQSQNEGRSLVLPSTDQEIPASSSPPKDSPQVDATSHQSDGPLFSQPSSPQMWTKSPRRNRPQPLSRQVALKALQKSDAPSSPQQPQMADSPERTPRADTSKRAIEDHSMYEDSFSEIPEAVLEAATPRRPAVSHHFEMEEEQEEQEDEQEYDNDMLPAADHSEDDVDMLPGGEVEEAEVQEESPSRSASRRGSIASSANQLESESNRLLTPDETPSPIESVHSMFQEKMSQAGLMGGSPSRSSPPAPDAPQQQLSGWSSTHHSRQNSSATPPRLASSPQLPPPPMFVVDNRAESPSLPSSSSRPALSPIVRAGRALQSVTSDPPSPKDRESLLGSPFRSSVGRPTPSPAPMQREATAPVSTPKVTAPTPTQPPPPSVPQSDRSWSKAFAPLSQLKNLVVQSAQVFSPRMASTAAPEESADSESEERLAEPVVESEAMFSDSPLKQPVFAANTLSSTRVHPPSDDEMQWEVNNSPPRNLSMAGDGRDSISSRFATKGSMDQPMGQDEDVEMQHFSPAAPSQAGDDDWDIWAVEAQRSTQDSSRLSESRHAIINPPRRSKLPSPWRQNSRRFQYNDEVARDAVASANEEPSRTEEYSMLSAQSSKEAQNAPQETAPKTSKVDLSSFFSSPAVLPKMQPPTMQQPIVPSVPQREEETEEPSPQPIQPTPSLPQKRFQFRDRMQSAAQKPAAQSQLRSSVLAQSFQPSGPKSADLFSLGEPLEPEDEAIDADEVQKEPTPVPPSTPDRSSFMHVAQKQNFTPRLGRSGGSLFKSPAKRTGPSLLAGGKKSLNFAPRPDHDSSFDTPDLKPLPEKTASPTKSCLRSPLKPKTPGRVVEFTSSTLSPLAQAQVRADRNVQSSGLASWGQNFSASTASQPRSNLPPQSAASTLGATVTNDEEADKENAPSPATGKKQQAMAANKSMSFTSSLLAGTPKSVVAGSSGGPTAAAGRQASPPLSHTTWSRGHWVRLDELLQERRRAGPLNFQLQHRAAAAPPSRRRSSALLGKQVAAQGETMTLEQWHLDVVDAFAAELGDGGSAAASCAWDENVLAKRLFALIVGEERRRLGLVPRRRAEVVV
ncbi:uncharacterized protein E0L32_006377 [Thyridium curvatum]|uniref:Uncharacterized protein n=1 Tax=Thyridium curvatum TaxID=1093900 RepID=A0A507B0C7_9PEZI|nr:uncharacterized protein E0L32_006377 [Thyridium curvatum]TPX13177.1 hypothetical protein E0L32_006377 [Thyridium curvatum]